MPNPPEQMSRLSPGYAAVLCQILPQKVEYQNSKGFPGEPGNRHLNSFNRYADMKVKPLVSNFIPPEIKHDSAGMDIYFQEDTVLSAGRDNVVKLGFAAEVPRGFVALLLPRSSAGIRGIGLRNTVGVIDSDYRGEWIAHLVIDEREGNTSSSALSYKRGERAIQAIIVPIRCETIELADKLSDTDRGQGGFGRTGK